MNAVAWAPRDVPSAIPLAGTRGARRRRGRSRSALRPLQLLILVFALAGCATAGRAGAGPTPALATATSAPVAATVYAGFAGRDGLVALRGDSGALRWRSAPQPVWAPSVSGGVAYAAAFAGPVMAFRATDGSVLWQTSVDGRSAGPVAVAGGVVYVGMTGTQAGAVSRVYALNASDGALRWNWQTSAGSGLPAAPLVAGDVVYAGTDGGGGHPGAVTALKAEDGSVLWQHALAAGDARALAAAGGLLFFGSSDHAVHALRAADGAEVWSRGTGGIVDAVGAAAGAAGADVVYAGSRDGNLYALRAADGATLWTYRAGDFVLAAPAVAGDTVYVGSADGFFAALSAVTGAVRWRACVDNKPCGTPDYGAAWSSPVIASGTLYASVTFVDPQHPHNIANEPGAVYALDATSGGVRWEYSPPIGGALGAPAVAP